jgi:cell division protein FtsQ
MSFIRTSKTKIVIAVTVLLFMFALYWLLGNEKLFPITAVKIKGSYSQISQQLLQQKITPFVQGSFFSVKTDELQTQLKLIPWIATVNIRRIFPSTIIVTIAENKAVYIWNEQDLLTETGVLFSPDKASYPKGLPTLNGPADQQAQVFAMATQFNQLLQALSLSIQSIVLSDRLSWRIVLNNNINIVLGKDNVVDKVKRLVKVYPTVIGDKANKVISIDMRYSNGLAVRWKK